MADSDIVGLAIISGDLAKRLKLNGLKRKRIKSEFFFQRKKKISMLFVRLYEIYQRREMVLRFWQEPSNSH